MAFTQIKAVISDMDGVLWRGDEKLPAMSEFFEFLRTRDIDFILATNNSGKHPAQYVERLAKMGVPDVAEAQVITSGTATADYLQQQYPTGARLFVIGQAGLKRVLTEAGFELVENNADVVVAGVDFDFNYMTARQATLEIRNNGAAFVGTNPDVTFPAPDGLVPGAGSIIGMIQIATDVDPVLIGKPAPAMFEVALRRLGASAAETLMLGDRLNTDIEGAYNVGIQTAMVLTGVNNRADAESFHAPPDYIFDDLPALMAAWD